MKLIKFIEMRVSKSGTAKVEWYRDVMTGEIEERRFILQTGGNAFFDWIRTERFGLVGTAEYFLGE